MPITDIQRQVIGDELPGSGEEYVPGKIRERVNARLAELGEAEVTTRQVHGVRLGRMSIPGPRKRKAQGPKSKKAQAAEERRAAKRVLVMELVGDGLTEREIAEKLKMSKSWVSKVKAAESVSDPEPTAEPDPEPVTEPDTADSSGEEEEDLFAGLDLDGPTEDVVEPPDWVGGDPDADGQAPETEVDPTIGEDSAPESNWEDDWADLDSAFDAAVEGDESVQEPEIEGDAEIAEGDVVGFEDEVGKDGEQEGVEEGEEEVEPEDVDEDVENDLFGFSEKDFEEFFEDGDE